MNEIDEQKNRLMKLKDFFDKKEVDDFLPIFEKLEEIAEHLKDISEREMPEMKMPEVHKVEIEGAEVLTIKGERGERGVMGPPGIDGKDGESIVGPKGENGKDGSPDTPEQVKEKLLKVGLTIEDITNLKETLEDMKKGIERRPIFGGGISTSALNFHMIDDETPSGTVNGSNTEFTIAHAPSPTSSLKVYVNGQRMRITEDYTFSGRTITFITAPPTGSILLVDYRI